MQYRGSWVRVEVVGNRVCVLPPVLFPRILVLSREGGPFHFTCNAFNEGLNAGMSYGWQPNTDRRSTQAGLASWNLRARPSSPATSSNPVVPNRRKRLAESRYLILRPIQDTRPQDTGSAARTDLFLTAPVVRAHAADLRQPSFVCPTAVQ